MKILVCEVCGGNELIKKEGVFKCMNCGMNYSLEEVRKLLADVTDNADENIQTSQNEENTDAYSEEVNFCSTDEFDSWLREFKDGNLKFNNEKQGVEAFDYVLNTFLNFDDQYKREKISEVEALLKFLLFDWHNRIFQNLISAKLANDIIDAFNKSIEKFNTFIEKFDIENLGEHMSAYINELIENAKTAIEQSWKNVVGRNYYRQDFDTYGGNWKTNGEDGINFYRPTSNEYIAFLAGVDLLIDVLVFVESLFDDNTTLETKTDIYCLIMLFENRAMGALAFKPKPVVDFYGNVFTAWEKDFSLTNDAVIKRRDVAMKYENLLKEARLQAHIQKIKEYWEANPEEKQRLESERSEIIAKISEYNKQIKSIPDADLQERLEKQLEKLTIAKLAMGSFSGWEKREKEKEINELKDRIAAISSRREKEKAQINMKIVPLQNRLDEISRELNRE